MLTSEDAADQMSAYGIDVSQGDCGFATVDRTYSESDIYIAVSTRQFELMRSTILSFGDKPAKISIRLITSHEFTIVNHRRIYKVEANPTITVVSGQAT